MENLWARIPTGGGPLAVGTAIFAKSGGFATLSVGLRHRDPNPGHSHRAFAGCWPKSSLALPGGGTGAEEEDGPRGRGDFRPPQQHLTAGVAPQHRDTTDTQRSLGGARRCLRCLLTSPLAPSGSWAWQPGAGASLCEEALLEKQKAGRCMCCRELLSGEPRRAPAEHLDPLPTFPAGSDISFNPKQGKGKSHFCLCMGS